MTRHSKQQNVLEKAPEKAPREEEVPHELVALADVIRREDTCAFSHVRSSDRPRLFVGLVVAVEQAGTRTSQLGRHRVVIVRCLASFCTEETPQDEVGTSWKLVLAPLPVLLRMLKFVEINK